jgi:hypothetical protein
MAALTDRLPAIVVAVLSDHILRVIPWRPEEQMIRVSAQRHIASMANIDGGREIAVQRYPHGPVHIDRSIFAGAARHANVAVSIRGMWPALMVRASP